MKTLGLKAHRRARPDKSGPELLPLPGFQPITKSAISPHGEQVGLVSIGWVERHGMIVRTDQLERLRGARLGLLAARCHPDARPEALQIISDWNLWLFSLDDGYCDESDFGARPGAMARMAARLMRIVDAPYDDLPAGAGRWAEALRDLRCRLGEFASPIQLQRWTAAVHDYLFGIVWEAANRAECGVPSVADYVHMRRMAGAIVSCLALVDVAVGVEVSAADWAGQDVRDLTRMAANLIGWDNDVFSYRKELADHGAMHNLVTVIAREQRCSLRTAVERAIDLRNDEVEAFLALEAEIRPTADGALRGYVDGLKQWVQGFLDYALASPRYAMPATLV